MKKKLKQLFAGRTTKRAQKVAGFAAASVGMMSLGSHAQAQTILQDDFTNSGVNYDTGIIGTSPDGTNLGGGVWGYAGSNDYDNRLSSNSAHFSDMPNFGSSRNGASAAISVQSNGSYVAPSTMTITAFVNPVGPLDQGTNNNTNPNAIGYLGFFSMTQSAHYQSAADGHMVGLALTSTGVLDYDVNGALTSTGITVPFAADGFAKLSFAESYSGSGYYGSEATISNIVVNGVSYSNTFTTASLPADPLSYAGFGGTSNGFAVGSAFAHLSVVGGIVDVPEPSSYALMAAGLTALAGVSQLRRRRNEV